MVTTGGSREGEWVSASWGRRNYPVPMQPPVLVITADELWQMACDPFRRVRQPEVERPADADAFRGFMADARDSSTYQLEIMATRWALQTMALGRTSGNVIRDMATRVLQDYANAVKVHVLSVKLPSGAVVGSCIGCIAIEHEFCLFSVHRDVFPAAVSGSVQTLAFAPRDRPVNSIRSFYAWAPTSGAYSLLAKAGVGNERS